MFKNIIAPVQAWLLSQGRCVGCGIPLKNVKSQNGNVKSELIACKCGRVYIHEAETGKYRRALLSEV